MEKYILKFIIEKAISQICEKEDWNIEVVQTSKTRFNGPSQEERFDENWEDTTFKVSFPNQFHTVDIQFYRLEFCHGISWQEVGVGINADVAESNLYRIGQLLSTAPYMIQMLKENLKFFGQTMDNAMDKVLEARQNGKMEELCADIKATKAKIAARDPEKAQYYSRNYQLECEEFLVRNIFFQSST